VGLDGLSNPNDQIDRGRFTSKLAQAGGVLAPVPLAVHHTLCERFTHADGERRIFEPREYHWLRKQSFIHSRDKLVNHLVGTSRKSSKFVKRFEILWFSKRKLTLTVANRPNEKTLDQVDMVKTLADDFIVPRRRLCFDGAPMFCVGPGLMPQKILKR
jgi:hypothetical protein